jgi:uncharacterized membrane protein YdjX (TVP38/TMEM64 family)
MDGTSQMKLHRVASHRLALLVAFIAVALIVRRYRADWFELDVWPTLVNAYPLAAPLAFVPAYALASTFLIPTLPLNIAAGVLWGPIVGTFLALAGSVLGALTAFGVRTIGTIRVVFRRSVIRPRHHSGGRCAGGWPGRLLRRSPMCESLSHGRA